MAMVGDSYDPEIGWVLVPDLLSRSDLDEVRRVCVELLALPESERRAGDKPASGTRHLAELDDRNDLIAAIVERERLVQVVSTIVGSDAVLFQAGYRCPQPTFGGQRLHADAAPKLADGPDVIATAIIALVDFTKTNGSTRVVPGSNRRPDLQRSSGSLERHPAEIHLIGPAGSAFVFTGHLLHAGSTNNSADDRPALQLVWRRAQTEGPTW